MIKHTALVLASTLILSSQAFAQSYAPTIPSPANPFPANPVATDGSRLPAQNLDGSFFGPSLGGIVTGRSIAIDPTNPRTSN